MKKFFISFVLVVALSYTGFSQNQLPERMINDTTEYIYCQIVGTGKLLSNKVTIEIDFGQFRSIWEDNRLKDPVTGNKIVFNGMIDALNYMGNNGWEFVQAYAFSTNNGPNVYHYLLKKSRTLVKQEMKEVRK